MKATSIHLKACDLGSAEAHNKREKELAYPRKDLEDLNEYFSYIDHSLKTEAANIRRQVKAKTGRKLQKNAIPIKEGVIVIDDNTTLKDLQNFCEECRTKFGMTPLSIAIHRDEGHPRAKDWKPNLHAHIIWRMYDDNGRNVRLSKQDMSDMQTLAAQHLHMLRGKSSDKKHLSAVQYKVKAETERLNSLQSDLNRAESDLKAVVGKYTAEVEKFYEDAAEMGLTCHEATKMRKDREESLKQIGSKRRGELSKPGIRTPEGMTVVSNDPKHPDIEMFYGTYSETMGQQPKLGLWVRFSLGWKPVKEWLRAVVKSPWFIVSGISNDLKNGQKMGW